LGFNLKKLPAILEAALMRPNPLAGLAPGSRPISSANQPAGYIQKKFLLFQ